MGSWVIAYMDAGLVVSAFPGVPQMPEQPLQYNAQCHKELLTKRVLIVLTQEAVLLCAVHHFM